MTDSQRLQQVQNVSDVPRLYAGTAIEDLLLYHNLGVTERTYTQAELLIGMCMDNRKRLSIPANFAFLIRTGGANLRGLEFQMSFAIAIGGVRAIAIIGHDRCGMSGLSSRRDDFVTGLVEGAGWERHAAEQHFDERMPRFEIGEEIEFTNSEARRYQELYPKLIVAPLFYKLDEGLLYIIESCVGSSA